MQRLIPLLAGLFIIGAAFGKPAAAEGDALAAARAMRQAAGFFAGRVAIEGSYGWRYTTDLGERWGEARLTPRQGWAQPPGTPAVGDALIDAYAATGDSFYLDAAAAAANALVRTQLLSGGWDFRLEFDAAARAKLPYRTEPGVAGRFKAGAKPATTFDDDTSQSAVRFLMRADAMLNGAQPAIAEAVRYGLDRFIEAQYANGAWPHNFDGRQADVPTGAPAAVQVPRDWPRAFAAAKYDAFYTFNDQTIPRLLSLFIEAHRRYGDGRDLAAARRAGDFALAAQLPPPQGGWAQQYDFTMTPVWARKFEPPAVASLETAATARALFDLARHTGEAAYAEAARRAADWLRAARLPGGDWARFYELGSDRGLYMTRDYALTYDDADLPSHYAFKGGFGIAGLLRAVETGEAPVAAPVSDAAVQRIVAALDGEGRWLKDGWIDSATFNANLKALAAYVGRSKGIDPAARWRPAPP